MTQNSNVSPETKTTESKVPEDVQKLVEELRNKGVSADHLAVLNITGSEQVIGEVLKLSTGTPLAGQVVRLKNPKRFIRIQSMQGGGLAIQFMIGDLDYISKGEISVVAPIGYWVVEQDFEAQREYFGTMLQYFDRRMKNRAVESGLHLPDTSIKGRLK